MVQTYTRKPASAKHKYVDENGHETKLTPEQRAGYEMICYRLWAKCYATFGNKPFIPPELSIQTLKMHYSSGNIADVQSYIKEQIAFLKDLADINADYKHWISTTFNRFSRWNMWAYSDRWNKFFGTMINLGILEDRKYGSFRCIAKKKDEVHQKIFVEAL